MSPFLLRIDYYSRLLTYHTVTEDYSEWESVDEEAEPPAPKTKPSAKAKPKQEIKKEEKEDTPLAPAKEKQTAPKKAPVKSASPAVKAKPSGKTGNKNQKGIQNFFGPPKKASS